MKIYGVYEIKSINVDVEVCVRIKGLEGEWFKIDSVEIQRCFMSLWLFNMYTKGDERINGRSCRGGC